MAGGRPYDADKFKELIVYVADRSQDDPRFGKTKLNKILFFSDFTAYGTQGKSITGADYQHLPQGPCPHQLMPALSALKSEGAAIVRGESTYGGTQQRVIALRDPRLDNFTSQEIAVVGRVLDRLRPLTNTEVSELSHETVAWQVTAENDEIPYGAALFSSDLPSEEDLAWLREVATNRGAVA